MNHSSMKKTVLKAAKQRGIVPVFYHPDIAVCQEVVKACYEGGIRVFEFVNRGEKAKKILLY